MIEQFFRAWFNAAGQAPLLASITGGVWPADAPPRTATDPYVTWQVVSETKVQSLSGLSGLTRSLCSLTVHSKTLSTAADIMRDIIGTKAAPKLIGYTGTISVDGGDSTMPVQGVRYEGERNLLANPYEGSANSWHAKQADVAIWWQDRTQTNLTLTMTASDETPVINGNVTFTITVLNNNNDLPAATGVIVNSLLPAGVTYVSSYTEDGSYSSVSGDWTIGTMNPTTDAVLQLVGQIIVLTAVNHTASITAAAPANAGYPTSATVTIDAHA